MVGMSWAKVACFLLFTGLAVWSGYETYKEVRIERRHVTKSYYVQEQLSDALLYGTSAICVLIDKVVPVLVVMAVTFIFQLLMLKRNNWRASE